MGADSENAIYKVMIAYFVAQNPNQQLAQFVRMRHMQNTQPCTSVVSCDWERFYHCSCLEE